VSQRIAITRQPLNDGAGNTFVQWIDVGASGVMRIEDTRELTLHLVAPDHESLLLHRARRSHQGAEAIDLALRVRTMRDGSRHCPEGPEIQGAQAREIPATGQVEEGWMNTITTNDGTTIYFKDWGPKSAQPIMFHHGWPLSSDDWDAQMLFFAARGYRVVAHDRRGHGRSSQVSDGHDMDHYAADAAAVVSHLDLRNAIHVGHSTGGGEALHYVARHGHGRVARLVLIGAVPPIMVKTPANPGGLPIEVFDGFRQQLAANRAQFYLDVASGPFYGFNRPGAAVSQGAIDNWWRQGMMGGAKAHYEGIKAFSETDFTGDLKSIDVPTLVMHGDDDQIVPIADSALLSAKLLENGTLKVYEKLPHGMCTTHADVINADLLKFCRAGSPVTA
jgi:non-heme chloroperoxidase